MTMEEIHEGLERRGEEKAETTVYHRVNVLKDAGMVEISRLEEADGGTWKYYRSNTRVFSYTLPGSSKETLTTAQETTTEELSDPIETLYEQHGDDIDSAVREMKPASTVRPDMKSFSFVSRSTRSLLALSETGTLNDLLTGRMAPHPTHPFSMYRVATPNNVFNRFLSIGSYEKSNRS
ncbi:transcriptional regulator [Halalkalicoccus salilacus]|uniref:transcriptional regulator n=1 Tax=Halalkalicoccus TaxID=332246 RepID=UPI002F961149